MRLAFVFILVGYGTKAGLAPMHSWLPDAHSQAPSRAVTPTVPMLSRVCKVFKPGNPGRWPEEMTTWGEATAARKQGKVVRSLP